MIRTRTAQLLLDPHANRLGVLLLFPSGTLVWTRSRQRGELRGDCTYVPCSGGCSAPCCRLLTSWNSVLRMLPALDEIFTPASIPKRPTPTNPV